MNNQEPEAPTLMIAGGGTGGHIYPAIAVAREFLRREQRRRVVFVGTDRGLESTIVPKEGFPLELISVGGLKGKGLVDLLSNLAKLPGAFLRAWSLLSRHRPSVVLGVGGYASGPILGVAALRAFPTMIQEQNAFPGITNRVLAKFVRRVAVAFPDALSRLGRSGVVTGNPVRAEFFGSEKPIGRGRRLLIFGGSQGSKVINDAIMEALPLISEMSDIEIVHQTGVRQHSAVSEAYSRAGVSNARVVGYLDQMAEEMRRADLAICRSGALTIGELAAVGLGSILIPFGQASDNHQEVNARAMEAAGGAKVITERELSGTVLAGAMKDLLSQPDSIRAMGEAARTLAVPDATARIVDELEGILDSAKRKN